MQSSLYCSRVMRFHDDSADPDWCSCDNATQLILRQFPTCLQTRHSSFRKDFNPLWDSGDENCCPQLFSEKKRNEWPQVPRLSDNGDKCFLNSHSKFDFLRIFK